MLNNLTVTIYADDSLYSKRYFSKKHIHSIEVTKTDDSEIFYVRIYTNIKAASVYGYCIGSSIDDIHKKINKGKDLELYPINEYDKLLSKLGHNREYKPNYMYENTYQPVGSMSQTIKA